MVTEQEQSSHFQSLAHQYIRCRTKTEISPSGSLQCHSAALLVAENEKQRNRNHNAWSYGIHLYEQYRSKIQNCNIRYFDHQRTSQHVDLPYPHYQQNHCTLQPHHIHSSPALRTVPSTHGMGGCIVEIQTVHFKILKMVVIRLCLNHRSSITWD
jgi:hypothetical protein